MIDEFLNGLLAWYFRILQRSCFFFQHYRNVVSYGIRQSIRFADELHFFLVKNKRAFAYRTYQYIK